MMTDDEWEEYEAWFVELNSKRICRLMDRRDRLGDKSPDRAVEITEEILSLFRLGRKVLGRPWIESFNRAAYWDGDWVTGCWRMKQQQPVVEQKALTGSSGKNKDKPIQSGAPGIENPVKAP